MRACTRGGRGPALAVRDVGSGRLPVPTGLGIVAWRGARSTGVFSLGLFTIDERITGIGDIWGRMVMCWGIGRAHRVLDVPIPGLVLSELGFSVVAGRGVSGSGGVVVEVKGVVLGRACAG